MNLLGKNMENNPLELLEANIIKLSKLIGEEDYTKQEISNLWNEKNITEDQFADKACRSVERCHEYRFCIKVTRPTRIFIMRNLREL